MYKQSYVGNGIAMFCFHFFTCDNFVTCFWDTLFPFSLLLSYLLLRHENDCRHWTGIKKVHNLVNGFSLVRMKTKKQLIKSQSGQLISQLIKSQDFPNGNQTHDHHVNLFIKQKNLCTFYRYFQDSFVRQLWWVWESHIWLLPFIDSNNRGLISYVISM
jgi:hypothetical protein